MSISKSNKHFTDFRFYPWIVISLSASFLFYKYILQVSPSIMTGDLMKQFHIEGAGLGNLAASFFYSFLIAQLFVGMLLDRFSPRLLTSLALLLCAIGAYFFSQSNDLSIAMGARTLMGIGAGFATVSYMKMTSLWFKPERFAFVGGLLATAAMLGAIAGQMPLSLILNRIGWRQSLLWCAILGLILACLFFMLVRNGPANKTLNTATVAANKKISFKDIQEVICNKQNWLITLYSGLVFSPIDAFAGLWCIPFLSEAYHLTHTQAASFVSLIFLGLAIGSPLLGLLSDHLGQRRKLMLISAYFSLITILIIIYFPVPLWALGCLLFLFGFGTSAFMLGFALGREINKVTVAATIIALINTGDVVFSALTEPLIGKLLDQGWSGKIIDKVHYFSVIDYRHALSVLPLYILLGIILLLYIREPKKIKTY